MLSSTFRLKRIIVALTLLVVKNSFSQGSWAWISGDTALGTLPIYGTKLQESSTNQPGSRYEPAEFIDKQGNLWVFGGGLGTNTKNDLWRFNTITRQWTWMSGDNTPGQPGNFGPKGVFSASSNPGSKGYGATSWTDTAGNLWIFAGGDPFVRNDLWKYDPNPASPNYNQWMWLGGDDVRSGPTSMGIYNQKKVADPTSWPAARGECATSWTVNNELWVFGGFAQYNDLWKYDINTGIWTWMSGESAVGTGVEVKGAKGEFDDSYTPNKQLGNFTKWKDKNNNLWAMLGGGIWQYNTQLQQWAWMGNESSFTNLFPKYEEACQYDENNFLPNSWEQRASWVDDCSKFWVYANASGLWKYTPDSTYWQLVKADTTIITGNRRLPSIGKPKYGTKGLANPNNSPGSRQGAVAWATKEGFWLFGGMATGRGSSTDTTLNQIGDLWLYTPDKPSPDFSTVIDGLCVKFNDLSDIGCNEVKSYKWYFDDPNSGSNNTSSSPSPDHSFTADGTYNVKLILTNCTWQTDSIVKTITVSGTALSAGEDKSISKGQSVQLNASGATNYNWSPAAGLSCINCQNPIASPDSTTLYEVSYIGANGCNFKDEVLVTVLENDKMLAVTNNIFTPDGDGQNETFKVNHAGLKSVTLLIFDRWGTKVAEITSQPNSSTVEWDGTKNGKKLPDGTYFYKVLGENLDETAISEKPVGYIQLVTK